MPEPRDIAISVIRTLRDAGHEALLAGGCVRDELLGLHPKDYDIATDAPPQRVEQVFTNTRAVGKAFGVMQVRSNGITIEVATFRTESGYSDNRRPDAVEFCDAQTDAQRRDFTINALFIDPLDTSDREGGRIIDYVAGLEDISAHTIRAVGNPDDRLAEDDLRALRAVRFAARLDFAIHPETKAAITRHAGELSGVSRERIGDELRRMLTHTSRAEAVALLQALALDGPILTEDHLPSCALPILSGLAQQAPFEVALAAWAIDRAAHLQPNVPPTKWSGGGSGGGAGGVEGVGGRFRRALCLSNDEAQRLQDMLHALDRFGRETNDFTTLPVANQKRAFAHPSAEDAELLLAVQNPDKYAALLDLRARLAASPSGIAPDPLVDGSDLIEMGYSPGPGFKPLLAAIYDAQLEDRVADRHQALSLARSLAESPES